MTKSATASTRFEELDSVRGLAAVAVWSFHLISLLPPAVQGIWPDTPFFGGLQAVRIFFVLSGFVLALPFLAGEVAPQSFLIKRVFRIWPAYIAAVATAIALDVYYAFSNGRPWHTPDPNLLLQHFLLIGSYNTSAFVPVLWSLVHEMRISLVFPWVVLPFLRCSARKGVVVMLLTFCVGAGLDRLLVRVGLQNSYTYGIVFLGMFMAGILLARFRGVLTARWSALPWPLRLFALAGALALFTFAYAIQAQLSYNFLGGMIRELLLTLSAAIFIVAALAEGWTKRILGWFPLRYLGRISYSFYLFHYAILQFLAYLGPTHLRSQPLLLVLVSFSITVIVSSIVYFAIEKPAIALGRRVAAFWKPATREPHLAIGTQ